MDEHCIRQKVSGGIVSTMTSIDLYYKTSYNFDMNLFVLLLFFVAVHAYRVSTEYTPRTVPIHMVSK